MPPAPPRSIREPGVGPRGHRTLLDQPPAVAAAAPAPRPRPSLEARTPKARPDANPLRLMLGFAGLASASAFTAAMLPSVAPAPAQASTGATDVTSAAAAQPQPSVQHVTRYVTLQPGQTAPPQSTVIVQPTPTPIVRQQIVTRTRQSGQP